MPEDILKQTARPMPLPPKKKHKVSAVAIFLAVILAISLILLGERIVFDLNRVANPVVEQMKTTQQSTYSGDYYRSGYVLEKNALSDVRVYYPEGKKGDYLLYKTLIHGAFIIPAFLLTFILYYLVFLKGENSKYKVLAGGYMAFAFWMIIRLLLETANFIIVQYKSAAVYIILVALVLIFTGLIMLIQHKMAQREMR